MHIAKPATVQPVSLEKSYRLINHGPTVLVSSAHDGRQNVMAAAWNMGLDFKPAKVCVVIDKSTLTRSLVERSGEFVLGVPARGIARETWRVGQVSGRDIDKFAQYGIDTFAADKTGAHLVAGCVGWLECKVIPEPHNQQAYDLFIGEVIAAHADTRVFRDGHWYYEPETDPALQTLHYIAGTNFLSVSNWFSVAARDADA
jgi:flavin reductase (DIM6/NTAB) family NADH-FMN oxidoreductase RutF